MENDTAVLYSLTELKGLQQLLEKQLYLENLPVSIDGFWIQKNTDITKSAFIAILTTESHLNIDTQNQRLWNDIINITSDHPAFTHRKIQHQELSMLPKKDWHLANNSFLLHGYYNYHHLLLVEKQDYLLLGVPGIYDQRESRAAELFGFPTFSADYVSKMNLEEEEYNSNFQFGHYLRKIRLQ